MRTVLWVLASLFAAHALAYFGIIVISGYSPDHAFLLTCILD